MSDNKMLGIVVRQSAVLEDRTPSLGEWREIDILRGIEASGCECKLICSIGTTWA